MPQLSLFPDSMQQQLKDLEFARTLKDLEYVGISSPIMDAFCERINAKVFEVINCANLGVIGGVNAQQFTIGGGCHSLSGITNSKFEESLIEPGVSLLAQEAIAKISDNVRQVASPDRYRDFDIFGTQSLQISGFESGLPKHIKFTPRTRCIVKPDSNTIPLVNKYKGQIFESWASLVLALNNPAARPYRQYAPLVHNKYLDTYNPQDRTDLLIGKTAYEFKWWSVYPRDFQKIQTNQERFQREGIDLRAVSFCNRPEGDSVVFTPFTELLEHEVTGLSVQEVKIIKDINDLIRLFDTYNYPSDLTPLSKALYNLLDQAGFKNGGDRHDLIFENLEFVRDNFHDTVAIAEHFASQNMQYPPITYEASFMLEGEVYLSYIQPIASSNEAPSYNRSYKFMHGHLMSGSELKLLVTPKFESKHYDRLKKRLAASHDQNSLIVRPGIKNSISSILDNIANQKASLHDLYSLLSPEYFISWQPHLGSETITLTY